MTREGAIGNLIHAIRWNDMPKKEALDMAIEALKQEPCNDMVSCGVFEQAMWERDVAIEQLKELGYELGEKITTDKDAISRQATIEAFKKWICSDYKDDYPIMAFIGIQAILEEQPSVNPQEPKTGKWIMDGSVDCYLDKVRCHCSECGKKKEFPADYDHIKKELSISYKYLKFIDNYCPNCGAKMVEPQETETWNGYHGQITAPKGTFERIFNNADDDNDI